MLICSVIILLLLQSILVQRAHRNTEIFEQVFGGKIDPTDQAKNFAELTEWRVGYTPLYNVL